jgi:hypothetical protein
MGDKYPTRITNHFFTPQNQPGKGERGTFVETSQSNRKEHIKCL